jgi:hypothetical protein
LNRKRKFLAWFLDLAQKPESEQEAAIDELRPRLWGFARSLEPQLSVDWDAEPFGAPPTRPLVMVRNKRRRSRKPDEGKCIHCDRSAIWRNKPDDFHKEPQGFCTLHATAAREEEAANESSLMLMPGLEAATPPKSEEPPTRPQGTDLGALMREVLTGLNSFLANSEWSFPTVTLTPTVSLGSGKKAKPERQLVGKLRDVVLTGLSDLLIEHGHKIRRCKASNCDKAFLSIRRQLYCTPTCTSNAMSERFQKRLGKEGFSERRHRYYEKAQRLRTGNGNLRVGRRRAKGK